MFEFVSTTTKVLGSVFGVCAVATTASAINDHRKNDGLIEDEECECTETEDCK